MTMLDIENDKAVATDDVSPIRGAVLWAFVGAGATAGAAVAITEAFAADVRGLMLALGVVLMIAAAGLALVLAVHQVLPPQRPTPTTSDAQLPAAPGELRPEAVLALWVFGGAGLVTGGITVFLSASGLASSVLVLSGLACLVMAAARRLPRFW